MDEIEGIAHRLGARVEHWTHLQNGKWGDYSHAKRRIRVLYDLDPVQYRSTVFHELGHAAYGHKANTCRAELEADAWAARQLIHPECWHHVTAARGDLLTVAEELHVLPRIAAVYATHLARHPAFRHH